MTLIPADWKVTQFRDSIDRAYAYSWYAVWLALIGLVILLFTWPLGVATLGGAVAITLYGLKNRKHTNRLISLHSTNKNLYIKSRQLFSQLQKANKVWRVNALVPIKANHNASYSSLIKREEVKISEAIPQDFRIKDKFWALECPNYKLYLLPEYFLILQDSAYRFESILETIVSVSLCSLPETETLPNDTEVIQRKHKYLTGTGNPHMGFASNPELDIVRYAWIRFVFPDLSEVNLMVSNIQVAQTFVQGIQDAIADALSEHRRAEARERFARHQFLGAVGRQLQGVIETGKLLKTPKVAEILKMSTAQVTVAGPVFERDGFRFIRTDTSEGPGFTWRVERI